jgi:hypothetical protein
MMAVEAGDAQKKRSIPFMLNNLEEELMAR